MVGDVGDMVLFWRGIVLIAISLFLAMPSIQLYRVITYPILQPDDRPCVRRSIVLLVLIVALGLGKGIWDVITYPGWNAVANWISTKQTEAATPEEVSVLARAFFCCWEIALGPLFSQLLIFTVLTLRAFEIQFDNDPIYRPVGEAGGAQ
jgi:hypothetical protein